MTIIKTDREIETMRQGGRILAAIMVELVKAVAPGVTTAELEQLALDLIKAKGARSAFKGYQSIHEARSFPTALCASINQQIVHAPALPARRLNSGDIISLDLGIEYPAPASDRSNQPFQHQPARNYGYFTDMALTVPVGKIDKQAQKLIKVAKKSLALGLAQAKPGNSLNNIGQAIQDYVESQGLAVVRDLVGHGVGTAVHEEPQVPNFKIKDNDFENVILQPGMTLAIEPMVSCGSWEIKNGSDGFSVVTADNSLSAHFEHTVAIGPKGGEVLTAL